MPYSCTHMATVGVKGLTSTSVAVYISLNGGHLVADRKSLRDSQPWFFCKYSPVIYTTSVDKRRWHLRRLRKTRTQTI